MPPTRLRRNSDEAVNRAVKRDNFSGGISEAASPVRDTQRPNRLAIPGGLGDSQRFYGEIASVPLDITSLTDITWTSVDITGSDLSLQVDNQTINVLTGGVYSIYWHVKFDYDPDSAVRFTYNDADWATSNFYDSTLHGQEFLDSTHVYALALDGFTNVLHFEAHATNPGALTPLTITNGFVIVRRIT